MATVSEIMVQAPATLSPDATLEEAWKLMRRLRIRHVPVCQASALIGIKLVDDARDQPSFCLAILAH